MSIEPLRVLFIAPYLPSAIRVRPFQIIRHLVKQGHRVTVVALNDQSPADSAALRELQTICDTVHMVPHSRVQATGRAALALPTPTPLWSAWCRSPKMLALVRSLAVSGRFDVAHLEHLRAAHFATALGDLPCVFDAVDCITDLQQQMVAQTPLSDPRHWLAWEEWAKLRRYEPAICRRFPQIAVTSRYDADALIALGVRVPIQVIPNGVDVPLLSTPDAPRRFDLIFSGKMSYRANENASLFLLNEILPRIDSLRPNAPPTTVCVVGSGPSRRLRNAAARWEGRVTITGYVDDLHPYLADARVAVCPMRIGVGIQNKALEAMAAGLPVVATPLVSRALNSAVLAEALRVAADAETFAHHCIDLLDDSDTAQRAGQAGREFVLSQYRWEDAAVAFGELYISACSR